MIFQSDCNIPTTTYEVIVDQFGIKDVNLGHTQIYKKSQLQKLAFLYSRRDLNPHERDAHWILSPTCLPIPPLEQLFQEKTRPDPDSYRDEIGF